MTPTHFFIGIKHTAVLVFVLAFAFALPACAIKPVVPDWQMNAHDAAQRAVGAHLAGLDRVAAAEWANAERETSRAAQPALMANLNLLRCAVRVASLGFGPCDGHERWQADATSEQQAYSAYLSGQGKLSSAQRALLPIAQQKATAAMGAPDSGQARLLLSIEDPLARLVAAAVMLQRGSGAVSGDAAVVAIDTASAQGWRRPLLAWLGVAKSQSLAAGGQGREQAAALQRRIDTVLLGQQ